MKINKITCCIDDITKTIEIITDNNVYDFNVSIQGIFVNIRINNSISTDHYDEIKKRFEYETMSHLMDGVYIYPEDGPRLEIDGKIEI